jgi:hypothetical protein
MSREHSSTVLHADSARGVCDPRDWRYPPSAGHDASPRAAQIPEVHVSDAAQPCEPEQQGWPQPPQLTHAPLLPPVLVPPSPPSTAAIEPWQIVSGAVQPRLQHGEPGAPHVPHAPALHTAASVPAQVLPALVQ